MFSVYLKCIIPYHRTYIAAIGTPALDVYCRFATKASVSSAANSLEAHFTCMRTRQPLALRAAAGSAGLKVWLHCDSMELAGELLQVKSAAGLCTSCYRAAPSTYTVK